MPKARSCIGISQRVITTHDRGIAFDMRGGDSSHPDVPSLSFHGAPATSVVRLSARGQLRRLKPSVCVCSVERADAAVWSCRMALYRTRKSRPSTSHSSAYSSPSLCRQSMSKSCANGRLARRGCACSTDNNGAFVVVRAFIFRRVE